MNNTSSEHSVFRFIILHILPGILTGIFYYLLVPVVKSFGYPSVMALCLSVLFVLLPFQFGILILEKKRKGVKLFKDLFPYTQPLKIWQYIVFTLMIILLSAIAFTAFGFTSDLLMPLFQWIPPGLFLDMGGALF